LGLGVTINACVWVEVREYSTWYRSGSDTKIKKEKDTYLCNNKIPLAMILGYIYSHIDYVKNNRKH